MRRRVIPCLTKSRRTPCRSFDGENAGILETCFANLVGQFLGAVKIGSREVSRMVYRIAVLAGGEIVGNDFPERGILKKSAQEPVDKRSETRNHGSKQHAARP